MKNNYPGICPGRHQLTLCEATEMLVVLLQTVRFWFEEYNGSLCTLSVLPSNQEKAVLFIWNRFVEEENVYIFTHRERGAGGETQTRAPEKGNAVVHLCKPQKGGQVRLVKGGWRDPEAGWIALSLRVWGAAKRQWRMGEEDLAINAILLGRAPDTESLV